MTAFVAAILAGFALSYGYWGMMLWQRFQNPFFPYFNDIFRSGYWEPVAFFDAKFRPSTLARWFTLPFGLVERNRLVSEVDLRDPRLALLCVFSVVLAIAMLRESRAAGMRYMTAVQRAMPQSVRLLAVFAGAAYVTWLVVTIYRYAIPLELTAASCSYWRSRCICGAARRDVLIGIASLTFRSRSTPSPNRGFSDIEHELAGPRRDRR